MSLNAAHRIIDANLNRATESLRVLEEYARFVLNDAALSGSFKQLRHDLADAQRNSAFASAIHARDIVRDVGTPLETAGEGRRTSTQDVARAAAKRLSEAMRSLEEYAKIDDSDFAHTMKRSRYQAYELERRLYLTESAATRFGHVRIYVILTESRCRASWDETAKRALGGGADCIQLREKGLTDRELLNRAKTLRKLCHDHGALCIVNDRPDVAVLAGADGVHVGQDDLTVADARAIVGDRLIVGVSTHTLVEAERAMVDVPDYLAIGPIFATNVKSERTALGPDILATLQSRTAVPVVPIGGIDEPGANALVALGAKHLCVGGAITLADDPTDAVARMLAMLETHHSQSAPI